MDELIDLVFEYRRLLAKRDRGRSVLEQSERRRLAALHRLLGREPPMPVEPVDDLGRRRFARCERAFATDRYTVLYRCWREDGERVLTIASSPVVGKALESGAAKIEPLVLPHAYSHLAPMASVA